MSKITISLLSMISLLGSGCATIVNGTKQPVAFSSTPEGAEVFVNGSARGVTPTTIELPRSTSSANVVFKKVGYQDTSENLHSSISGYYFLNILLGGVIGLVLDAVDGAWFSYDDSIVASLPVDLAAQSDHAATVAPAAAPNPASIHATYNGVYTGKLEPTLDVDNP
jgi:PEGA domain